NDVGGPLHVGDRGHAHEAFRGKDLDQHFVRGEVQGRDAGRMGSGRRRWRGPGDEGPGGGGQEEGETPGDPRPPPAPRAHAASAGSRPATTKPSRRTTSPVRTRTAWPNIGPSQAKVWNSPFSPQGSTPAGRRASRSRSKAAPAQSSGRTRGSTQVRRARSPPRI